MNKADMGDRKHISVMPQDSLVCKVQSTELGSTRLLTCKGYYNVADVTLLYQSNLVEGYNKLHEPTLKL